jgi:stage II sporulation protein D
MSVKRKLILIGICVIIVIFVFTTNVIQKMNNNRKAEPDHTILQEEIITQAEAYRLLSYLEFNKAERESLAIGITYKEEGMSGWYDSFVNAVWKMGLIEGLVVTAPDSALTYLDCKRLIDQLIIQYPDYQRVYSGLSFDFSKAEEAMSPIDFIELYQKLISVAAAKKQKIKEETLLVLGEEVTEAKDSRMITDIGKLYYQYAKDYMKYYEQLNQKDSPTQVDNQAATGDFVTRFKDKAIKALVCDQELIYVSEVTDEKVVVHNVYIEKGEGLQIKAFVNGIEKSFPALYKLSKKLERVVADITVENGKVVKILQKPDIIRGKVLQTGKDFIEIEGYGKLPLEENYRIYKIYDKLSMEPTNSILVGYENTDFVVSLGKISAALIKENIKAENIRVLLQTSGYQGYYHQRVELTASSDFTIYNKKTKKSYTKGELVTLEAGDDILSEGRLVVTPKEEDARIELLSIQRSDGNPKYRGSLEITQEEKGILLINELPMEEYLYAVIPSEMPTYYGLEALKVQAVCARSYAYKHLMANSLSAYGAHVDDSVSYQVYNNISENEASILAVKDTYGKVIKYDGEVITAYYFSTSCGHTASVGNVWMNAAEYPYLKGKLLYAGEADAIQTYEAASETSSAPSELYDDLSSEDRFRSFIEASNIPTYDSSFSWYRWKVTLKAEDIRRVIDDTLAARYDSNPELILTKTGKNKETGEDIYESIPINSVGDIVDISVLKRESSGIISELLITGEENTIKVRKEYNIRALLAPTYATVIRQDDSEVKKLKLLPSAFIAIDKKKKGDKLKSITLLGGGYGHGVGMSQNGVKALADLGKDYEAILSYFYEGTQLGYIYD